MLKATPRVEGEEDPCSTQTSLTLDNVSNPMLNLDRRQCS